MKLRLLILFAAALIFFSSCNKENHTDPVLEIYITTKATNRWQDADLRLSNVRFAIITEEGDQGWGSLQNFFGVGYETELQNDHTQLIFNDTHFDIEKLAGLKLIISKLLLSNGDEGVFDVELPWFTFGALDQFVALENGKTYRIDFTLDLDELIYEEDGGLVLDNNYGIEVTEL